MSNIDEVHVAKGTVDLIRLKVKPSPDDDTMIVDSISSTNNANTKLPSIETVVSTVLNRLLSNEVDLDNSIGLDIILMDCMPIGVFEHRSLDNNIHLYPILLVNKLAVDFIYDSLILALDTTSVTDADRLILHEHSSGDTDGRVLSDILSDMGRRPLLVH